jgi:hypothetical protein
MKEDEDSATEWQERGHFLNVEDGDTFIGSSQGVRGGISFGTSYCLALPMVDVVGALPSPNPMAASGSSLALTRAIAVGSMVAAGPSVMLERSRVLPMGGAVVSVPPIPASFEASEGPLV